MTKFPVKFPVSRELRAETGSRTTGSSGPINYRNCGPFLRSLSSAFSNFRFDGANKLETYLLSTETGSIVANPVLVPPNIRASADLRFGFQSGDDCG